MSRGHRALFSLSLLLLAACAQEPELSTDSPEAQVAYEEGLAEMRRFRMPEAVEHFEAAVAADSSFALAHLELGRCYGWVGRHDEVDSAFDAAYRLREGAREVERLQIEHAVLSHRRDLEGANAVYAELTERYPDEFYTLQLAAVREWRDKHFDVAAEHYQRILDKDPSRVDVHNLLGYLHLEAGEYDEAIQSFQRYVYYAPDLANPHDSLGDAFLATGQYEEAIAQYRESLKIDYTFQHSYAQLATVLIETGQCEQAATTLEKSKPLFEQRRQMPHYENLLLMIELQRENWPELAKRAYALQQSPRMEERDALGYALNASALELLALVETGDLEAAEKASLRFEEHLKQLKDAYEEQMASELEDTSRLARALVAACLERGRGEAGDSIDALQAAIAKSPRSPHQLAHYRVLLARSCQASGELDRAIEALNEVLRVIPTYPHANLCAAEIYAEMGRSEDVLRHAGIYLEVMRRADPDHPGVERARLLAEQFALAN